MATFKVTASVQNGNDTQGVRVFVNGVSVGHEARSTASIDGVPYDAEVEIRAETIPGKTEDK